MVIVIYTQTRPVDGTAMTDCPRNGQGWLKSGVCLGRESYGLAVPWSVWEICPDMTHGTGIF